MPFISFRRRSSGILQLVQPYKISNNPKKVSYFISFCLSLSLSISCQILHSMWIMGEFSFNKRKKREKKNCWTLERLHWNRTIFNFDLNIVSMFTRCCCSQKNFSLFNFRALNCNHRVRSHFILLHARNAEGGMKNWYFFSLFFFLIQYVNVKY